MAGLPPDGQFLAQSEGNKFFIVDAASGQEILAFNLDANSVAVGQKIIFESDQLSQEQKCFAHFWSGYFYAHKGN